MDCFCHFQEDILKIGTGEIDVVWFSDDDVGEGVELMEGVTEELCVWIVCLSV